MLGKSARDKITGFEGIVIGRCEYLYGCTQYGLAPPAHEGKAGETSWFDEGRIEITGPGIEAGAVRGMRDGGPNRDQPNRV